MGKPPDYYHTSYIIDALKVLPAIDAEPVRRGRWIDENCSECGHYVYRGDARSYCPNCGARMGDVDIAADH
ncbi:MAG: hypothetical protein IKE25_14025 [Clostridia bacterium]|nr:hypothetical protein [Clostridia bacterium]